MNVQNLTPKPLFIGSAGTSKFARGERTKVGQGVSLAPNGQPGDTASIKDWHYHSDSIWRELELAGKVLIMFSSAPDSGVVQPEIDSISGGLGGAISIPLNDAVHLTNKITWKTISATSIDFSRLAAVSPVFVWNQLQVPGVGFAEVRLYNETDAATLTFLGSIGSIGQKQVAVPVFPVGSKIILLQHRITSVGGGQSKIKGGTLHTG